MDWFKVKVNHVFYDGLNRTEGWAWIKIMSLTAQLERIPTEKQMLSIITKRELKLLIKWCETISKPLTNLLESVMKDAATLEKNREKLKQFRHKNREKQVPVTVTETVSVPDKKIREDKIREDKREYRASPFTPPTLEEVQTYCQERNNAIDASAFMDYYSARGWMISKNKMKDWRAAIRTWENRAKTDPKGGGYFKKRGPIDMAKEAIERAEILDAR